MRRTLVLLTLALVGCKSAQDQASAPAAAAAAEPEALSLNGKPIAASFGLGEGVSFSRPDAKRFTFDADAAQLVIIHYKARDIASDEVVVSVNEHRVANVPPDNLASDERENQAFVPRDLIKERGNTLVFDSVRNPPGNETWRVWGVWLEAASLPAVVNPLAEAQAAVEAARKLQASGTLTREQKFHAWKQYRQAQMLLEAVPDRPADLYDEVQRQLKALAPEPSQAP